MMTNEEIQNLYFQVKLSKQRRKCPRCSSDTQIECSDDAFLRRKWKRCRLLFTIWKSTFFKHAHLNNILLPKIIKLWFTGASCGLMAHILGCSKQNIVNTINKLQIFNIYERYFKDVKQIIEETTSL
ncbi:hypothetical protein AAJ76_1710001265 [Vairimorpha ceranae]|uniref:Transposase n=1 Tax=Vairimorpha ceranae TaxID=40302 RepID=A0A0F9WLH2_9MICR|nr:hypothetical protein AAJ76_1710001265 [Vairimorpha ceranae]KKO73928.1 hypothetical protein AAJ76_1710001265 [Vairimorpha ceranae]